MTSCWRKSNSHCVFFVACVRAHFPSHPVFKEPRSHWTPEHLNLFFTKLSWDVLKSFFMCKKVSPKTHTIVTDVISKLILPEYYPVTTWSKATKINSREFQPVISGSVFSKCRSGNCNELPTDSLGIYLGNCLVADCRKYFASEQFPVCNACGDNGIQLSFFDNPPNMLCLLVSFFLPPPPNSSSTFPIFLHASPFNTRNCYPALPNTNVHFNVELRITPFLP